MSYTDTSGSTDQSSTSLARDTFSFIMPRDPSITKPWMRPRPAQGKNLCDLFEDENSFDTSLIDDQHLKVYLRIKPFKNSLKKQQYEIQSKKCFVTIHEECKSNKENVKTKKLFNFSHIFDKSSQEDIYNCIIKDNLAKFIDGNDYTIMTYGPSGSGKTYSLMGTDLEPGIIPRSLESLFNAIKVDKLPHFKPNDSNSINKLNAVQKEQEKQYIQWIVKNCSAHGTVPDSPQDKLASYRRMSVHLQSEYQNWNGKNSLNKKYEVWVSFAEIYNENIYDLLRHDSTISSQPLPKLRLIHTANNQSYIKGIRWVYVKNGTEAYAALERGQRLLRYAHTNMNSHSSRSHCLFTLRLLQYNDYEDVNKVVVSTFRLCDLAGSERAKRTGNEGVRMAESGRINSSLFVLEKCLTALRKQQNLPPYRESKLTSLLQNALCGNEAIGMLVTINPDPALFVETQHTLQFSAIAKKIRYIEPKADNFHKSKSCFDLSDRISDYSSDMIDEIAFLKDELERIKIEYEKREVEVRKELSNKFMIIKQQSDIDFETRLAEEKKWQKDLHDLEIERLENQMYRMYDDHKDEVSKLKTENESLKKIINDLMKKEPVVCPKIIEEEAKEVQVKIENHNNSLITKSILDDSYVDNIVENMSNLHVDVNKSNDNIRIKMNASSVSNSENPVIISDQHDKIEVVELDVTVDAVEKHNVTNNINEKVDNDCDDIVAKDVDKDLNKSEESNYDSFKDSGMSEYDTDVKDNDNKEHEMSNVVEETNNDNDNSVNEKDTQESINNSKQDQIVSENVNINVSESNNINESNKTVNKSIEITKNDEIPEDENLNIKHEINDLDQIISETNNDDVNVNISENKNVRFNQEVNSTNEEINESNDSQNEVKTKKKGSRSKMTKSKSEETNNNNNKSSRLKLRRKTHCTSERAKMHNSSDEETCIENNENCNLTINVLSNNIENKSPNKNVDEKYITPVKKNVRIACDTEMENCKFYTEKKDKAEEMYTIEKGALTVGGSRRKLFAKRQNNEMAAETKEVLRSTRHLTFEEDSPGVIQPPKVQTPYVYEKRTLRSTYRNKK